MIVSTTLQRLIDPVTSAKQTLGLMTLYDNYNFPFYVVHTLELPWKNNEKKISCIPTGEYNVVKRYSEKYGNHFHILNVPNRDYILIHAANYVNQLLGCIAVGDQHVDINKDGLRDVTNSKGILTKLNTFLPDKFVLCIK